MRRQSVRLGLLCVAICPTFASANMILSLGGTNISHLSEQVMDQPRSAAGRRKNVWDADPPDAAASGQQYFLFDYGPDGKLLPESQRSIRFNAYSPGPGYTATAQLLVYDPATPNMGAYFVGIPASTSYDNPENFYDFPIALQELGVLRIQFTKTNANAIGQISGSTDSPELGYDGAKENGQFVRGDEQVRIFTSTAVGHDDDTYRGMMSAVVPVGYFPDFPTIGYDDGYLSFNEGTFTGEQVASAQLTVPEPACLAAVAGVAGLVLRRRSGR